MHLADDLRESGFEVWLDQRQLSGQLPYWEEIQTAVEQCTHFLFVISPDSIKRESGAMKEMYHAVRHNKIVVPIIARETPFDDIPMVVGPGMLQIHDFTKLPYIEGLQKVNRALHSAVPTPASDTQKQMVSVPPPERAQIGDTGPASTRSTSGIRWARIVAIFGVVIVLVTGSVLSVMAWNSFRANSPTEMPTTDPRVATIVASTLEAETRVAQIASQTMAVTPLLSPTPTLTLTLTETPIDPLDIVNQIYATRTAEMALTIAAYTKTPTPTYTATLNYQKTAEFIVAATDAQATANIVASYTKTPTPTNTLTFTTTNTSTPTYTPTDTPTLTMTYTATATSTSTFTFTPSITPTPTLTPYPTLDETQTPTTWQPIMRTFDHNGYSVEMVLVPAGNFMMGDDTSNQEDERPTHSQRLEQPFWIDRYEVTNEQFDRLGGAAANKSNWTDPLRPRESISWIEAKAFCEQKRGGFLPTEAQWEWVARGPQSLEYPWGYSWAADKAVWNRNSSDGTANVGSIPDGKAWVGALDMSGNVWEWTSSLYKPYPYKADDGRENQDSSSGRRVLRGGSWYSSVTNVLRPAVRSDLSPSSGGYTVGFRCIRSF